MKSFAETLTALAMAGLSLGCVADIDGTGAGDGTDPMMPGTVDPTGQVGGVIPKTGPGMVPPAGGVTPPVGGLIDSPKPGTPMTPASMACAKLPPSPRVVRLTRAQYENSVRALTGLTGNLAGELPVDPSLGGFNRGNDLEVSDLVGRVYRDQAEKVAAQVVASPMRLGQVVGCTTKDDACVAKFITGFGLRVFRRPLLDTEIQKYTGLFKMADGLVETGDVFTKGVQVVVEAMLQSPRFLYRAERSTKVAGASIPLDSYEVAQKLSFTLANITPDAELLDAAAKNELIVPDKVTIQARRLLGTAEGRASVRDFTRQWMASGEWHENAEKVNYKDFKAAQPSLPEEVELFVDEITFNQKKGLSSLFTAPLTFVNKATAPYYGVTGTFSDQMTKVALDPARRSGLLTSVGFLGGRSYGNRTSPIHRGVTIGRNFLCSPVPDPSANVAPLPPSSAGKTMRQIVTEHTSVSGCRECHANFINPLGFALENYDEAGKWRDTEAGQMIDASGTLVGTAGNAAFKGAIEMAKAVVAAPESRTCFADNWWRYAFGRGKTDADSCALDVLAKGLANDSYTAVDLLVDMTRSQAFMFRSTEVQ